MDIKLKQRLVGALVLIALGVIFLPMLLDGDGPLYGEHEAITIPPEPAPFKSSAMSPDMPAPMAQLPDAPLMPEVLQVNEEPREPRARIGKGSVESGESAPKVPMVARPVLSYWSVQVGSFGSEANAIALVDLIKKAGHDAFTQKAQLAKGTVYRVRVGSSLDRGQAEKLRDELKTRQRLSKARVVSHP